MQRRILTLAAVPVLAAALLAAGCGGGGGTAAETIEIAASEFAFQPDTISVDAPGTYTLVVVNEGEAPHALALEGSGVDGETAVIEGGETAELTVEIAEAGEYRLVCPVDGHEEQGMTGTLVVEAR